MGSEVAELLEPVRAGVLDAEGDAATALLGGRPVVVVLGRIQLVRDEDVDLPLLVAWEAVLAELRRQADVARGAADARQQLAHVVVAARGRDEADPSRRGHRISGGATGAAPRASGR